MSWAEAFTRAVSYLVGQVIAFGAAASIVGLGLLIADSATERESETGQRIGYVLMGLGVLVGIVLEFAVFLKAIVDALIDKLQFIGGVDIDHLDPAPLNGIDRFGIVRASDTNELLAAFLRLFFQDLFQRLG